MKTVRIPSVLHDVFGEKPSVGQLVAILAFGGAMTAALYGRFPELADSLPVWRGVLALLLIFDVFAGCVANFTASTSNFYAARPTNRLVFIVIHVHIVLIAMLLDVSVWQAAAVWAYTIAGAFVVNARIGRPSQRFAAGLLLSIGLGAMPLLPDMPPYMLIACMLFMLKVLFSFAVDHYGGQAKTAGTEA